MIEQELMLVYEMSTRRFEIGAREDGEEVAMKLVAELCRAAGHVVTVQRNTLEPLADKATT